MKVIFMKQNVQATWTGV